MSYKEDLNPTPIACTNRVNFNQSWYCHQYYTNCTNTCGNYYTNCTNDCNNYYTNCTDDCNNYYTNSTYCFQQYSNCANVCTNSYTNCTNSCHNSYNNANLCSQTYSNYTNGLDCGTKVDYYVNNQEWYDSYKDCTNSCGDSYNDCTNTCVNRYNDSSYCSQSYNNCTNICSNSYANCSNTCTNYYTNCVNDCNNYYTNCTNSCQNYYTDQTNDCHEYTNYTNVASYQRYNTGLPGAASVTWSTAHWSGNQLVVEKVNDSESVFEEIRKNINKLNEMKGQHTTSDSPFQNPTLSSLTDKVDDQQFNTMANNLNTLYSAISKNTLSGNVTSVSENTEMQDEQVEHIKAKIDALNSSDLSHLYSNTYTRTDPVLANYYETKYNRR